VPDDATGSMTNGLNNSVTFTTDRFGNYTSFTDALANTTTWTRDANGQVLTMTQPDPDGEGEQEAPVTEFEYDSRGNLILITWPDSTTHEFEYEEDFNQLTSFTDELGRVTLYEIDPANGNLLSERRVVGEVDDEINEETDDVVTSFTYTAAPEDPGDLPAGLLLTVTDALGRITTYAYETDAGTDFGRLISITYADGTADEATEQFEYDAAGNVTAWIDPLGRRTELTYLCTVQPPAWIFGGGGGAVYGLAA
jgi:YD repeat-containing protein